MLCRVGHLSHTMHVLKKCHIVDSQPTWVSHIMALNFAQPHRVRVLERGKQNLSSLEIVTSGPAQFHFIKFVSEQSSSTLSTLSRSTFCSTNCACCVCLFKANWSQISTLSWFLRRDIRLSSTNCQILGLKWISVTNFSELRLAFCLGPQHWLAGSKVSAFSG